PHAPRIESPFPHGPPPRMIRFSPRPWRHGVRSGTRSFVEGGRPMKSTRIGRRAVSACALFAAGLAVGLLLPRGPGGLGQAAAQDRGEGTTAEQRLRQLKLDLPPATKPKNTFVQTVRVGNLLFVSGHGPSKEGGKPWVGRLGQDLDVE